MPQEPITKLAELRIKASQASQNWKSKLVKEGYTGHLPVTPERKAAHDSLMIDHFRNFPEYSLD